MFPANLKQKQQIVQSVTAQRLCKVILHFDQESDSLTNQVGSLINEARNQIPPYKGEKTHVTHWNPMGVIRDPLGFQVGTLFNASGILRFIASANLVGELASIIALDNKTRKAVIVDVSGQHISTITMNEKRNHAFFLGECHEPIGDVSQDFGDGHSLIRTVSAVTSGYTTTRRAQLIQFRQGEKHLGSIEFRSRISPVDQLLSAWFAMSTNLNDPKVI